MKRMQPRRCALMLIAFIILAMQPAIVSAQKREAAYFCPMDAGVASDKPGTCPECGMDLVRRKPAKRDRNLVRASELQPGVPAFEKKLKSWTVRVYLTPAQDTGSLRTVRVDVVATKKGLPISDAEVWFHAVYPSGRNLMPLCTWNGTQYEGAIDLAQQGVYTMMVHVNRGDDRRALTFRYEQ